MHEQAQLRLKKEEVIKLGAEVYLVQSHDLLRTQVFKEENRLLSRGNGPFSKQKSLVFSTALADAPLQFTGSPESASAGAAGWRTTRVGLSSIVKGYSPTPRIPRLPRRLPT